MVFHSGYEKWRFGLRPDIWLEGSLITWNEVLSSASGMDAKIAIENIFEDEPHNLKLLMKELGSERFGLCFDAGHFNLFSKTPLSDWLGELLPHIKELHLHDNLRDNDTHLPIGEGTFDFETLFKAVSGLSPRPLYTIEAHSPEDVLKGMERFNEFGQRYLL